MLNAARTLSFLWLLTACGGTGATDAGTSIDAGPPDPSRDAGPENGDAGPEGDAGRTPDGGVDVDAGAAAIEPSVVIDSRCGLDFRWLPPEDVGHLVSFDTPHSSLTRGESNLVQLALLSQGINLSRGADYDTRAHRMIYTTQDRGAPREATALVVLPEVEAAETLPVLLWHHGTTGLNDQCAPSFNIEDDESTQYDVAVILSVLSSYGYVIVAPDYLGQKSVGAPSPALHPYLVGEPTAIASLDALDAARELAAMRPDAPTFGRVALYGASQGGHAAFFTALYAPHYAPDVDLGAAVYVVPPTDLGAHFSRGISSLSPPSGNVALWVAGANAWYEPASGLSDVIVSPYDVQLPSDVAADCSPSTFDHVTDTDEVFTPAFRAASSAGAITGPAPWSCYAREASVTRTALAPPTIPGLVIQGERDTLVDTAIERAAFPMLCANGHDLDYLECEGAGHEEAFFYSIDDALDFIDAQLTSPTSQPCAIRAARQCASEL